MIKMIKAIITYCNNHNHQLKLQLTNKKQALSQKRGWTTVEVESVFHRCAVADGVHD
jgi:hypothetical protein